MVQFYSEHNEAMARYEKALGEAKASNQDARAARRQSIEDDIVAGGMEAVVEYEQLMDRRWQAARCLAEYDGVSMGRGIARRARARVEEAIATAKAAETETKEV